MIVRPTFLCGSTISPPLLVIVVKPLKARIEKATEASRASALVSETGCENAPDEKPLAKIAATANSAMPPILMADMISEKPLTDLLPAALTR